MSNAFFEAMRRAAEAESVDDVPSFPVMEAQAMELRGRWESAQTQARLVPGDLCMEKHGIGARKAAYNKAQLAIFWRLLDFDNAADQMHLKRHMKRAGIADRPDCLIGVLSEGDQSLMLIVSQVSHLVRWHPEASV